MSATFYYANSHRETRAAGKKGNQLPYALSLNIQVIAINGGCFSTLEFVGT